MGIISQDTRTDLRAELARLIARLAQHLRRQRERGRTPAADAVRGLVIEEGEAEGLLAELAEDWDGPPSHASRAGGTRVDVAGRAGPGADLPLRHAARAFDLLPGEYDALLLALGVELDSRLARLVAYLNDHVGQTRPTVGLAAALAVLGGGAEPSWPAEFRERPLVRDGLVELEGDGPAPCQFLRLPRAVLLRLIGSGPASPDIPNVHLHPHAPGLLERLVLDQSIRDRIAIWAGALRERPGSVAPLVLAGAEGSGRTSVARAAVSGAGYPLVTVAVAVEPEGLAERLRGARREARWHGAALLVRATREASAALDWEALWSGLSGLGRPLLLALPPDAVERAAEAVPHEPAVVRLAEPGPELRARLWQALLPRGDTLEEGELSGLAARFRFGPARIARSVRRAVAELSLRPPGERRLTAEALSQACRAVGSAAMGTLAQKLTLPFTRADLIVPDRINAELDLAVAWVRHQRQVLERWGFARRLALGRGLTALFTGPPGTGKTMAAQVLARALDLDLYRVDLSRVMSKYIGETEKNLGRLFDEAHASGAVLFFDEADALFGKRSEVKDAHDRYANVEIGYLLQRMEEYDGVTVLATNRMGDLDEAFIRRFHFIVDFPLPDAVDRQRIWEGMFPPEAERDPDLDLTRLARRFEISGGEIKNVVLAAAYLAAAEGGPVQMTHLARALRRELVKSGRVLDERELPALTESPGRPA